MFQKLRYFVGAVLDHSFEMASDIDGYDLQEMLVASGLTYTEKLTAKEAEEDPVAIEWGMEEGDTVYRPNWLGRWCLRAFFKQKRKAKATA